MTTEPSQPEVDREEVAPLHCYHCGQAIAPGGEVCPRCQRKQMRMCFCGNKIPSTQAFCEFCGADWRRSLRVHRKTKKRLRPIELARAGLAGCAVALVVGAIAHTFVGALARQALDSGQQLPDSFLARLGLAAQYLGEQFSGVSRVLTMHLGGLALLLTVALVGALVGVAWYLQTEGFLRLRPAHKSRGSRVRRRRRDRQTVR